MSVSAVLLDILVVLIAAKAAAEIAERVGVPAVVGEILAGVVVGPSVLGLVGHDDVLRVLAEVGVILLLLSVGLEMRLPELVAVGRASLSVAVIGVVVPMATGFGVGEAFGYDAETSLFLGAALAATSVGITARVFSDLAALASVEARTVLGAAVADDVLGLIVLTVVVRLVTGGSVGVGTVAGVLALTVGFLLVAGLLGGRFAPALFEAVDRRARSAGTLAGVALAFALAFAELADVAKLAPIVGAFVAGVALSGSSTSERITRELTPVGHLFIPVFFLQIGIEADIEAFVRPEVLGIAGGLLVVATLGKLVAAFGAVGTPADRWLVGIGMLPRGEVGLIFATIGLEVGVLDDDLYAALLLVVLCTTLAAPPLLRLRLARVRESRRTQAAPIAPPPPGGYLQVRDGVVDLVSLPPDHMALRLAFDAALEMTHAGPSPALLDWLGGLGDRTLRWDREASERFLEVLRRANSRSWRFLDTTGVLVRALPELAEAVGRRRADPFVVDPSSVLRFPIVEEIRRMAAEDERAAQEFSLLEHPEWLLLAALVLDVAGEAARPVAVARRLVQRLDLGAEAEEGVALLVGNAGLLRAAAGRRDGLEEDQVLPLVAHLSRPERARAMYVLSLALGSLDSLHRSRLDRLLDRIVTVMGDAELAGFDARTLDQQHRARALRMTNGDAEAAEWIEHAPRAYVLAQRPEDIVRHARLLEPAPRRDAVRARAFVSGDDEWTIEVVARDRPGLLAMVTGVLSGLGLDVRDAVVATWPNGHALECFRVRPPTSGHWSEPPPTARLERAIEEAFAGPMEAPAVSGVDVEFDDECSPWHTRCDIEAPDRPDLLHAISVALAEARVSVHSARVRTERGRATDRFELNDTRGQKLDEAAKERVRRALAGDSIGRGERLRRLLSP